MHKYSDNCTCSDCHATFFKKLLRVIDRNERAAKKRKKKRKQ